MIRVSRPGRLLSGILVILSLLVLATVNTGDHRTHITAEFSRTIGIYKGSEVRLMGVPIGKVTAINPGKDGVRVEMEYDAKYRVAANARALLVSTSIISDRFVQLTPAYDGHGRVLGDGAFLPESRTDVPVELDDVFRSTNTLLEALGPRGANKHGALSRFLSTGADLLDGQGTQINDLLHQVAGATGTLASSQDDIFDTIGNLDGFTGALSENDAQVRSFSAQMADVTSFLATERNNLSSLLSSLAETFGHLETFVRDNRALLVSNVGRLSKIAAALAAERRSIANLLEVLPTGAANLAHTFDTSHQGLRSRINEDQLLNSLKITLCDSLVQAGIQRPSALCRRLTTLLTRRQPR